VRSLEFFHRPEVSPARPTLRFSCPVANGPVWLRTPAKTVAFPATRGAASNSFRPSSASSATPSTAFGGAIAPDPARRVDRNYPPAAMASAMWNHAPEMWAARKQQGLVRAALTPESAGDLFAYFAAAHYFERPGDAARGRAAFTALHCSVCHGITKSNAEGAPPVAQWESLAEPAALRAADVESCVTMRHAYAQRSLAWQPLTPQELTDILVYLQNLPETRHLAANLLFPPAELGEVLFQSKG